MRTIKVEITGETPLLMHNAEYMIKAQGIKRNPAKQYDPKKDAENVAYRTKNKELYVPSRCVKACLISASSWFKFGKKSAKPIVAGCTRILPEQILLGTKKYEIDLRPVNVQRQRIIRARPRIDKWKLKFEIIYNDKIIQNTEILKQILEEAGQRVGLLDNRPQTYGENGCFKITKWQTL